MSIRKGIYRYQGEVFEIVQTSPDSAKLGLNCGKHEHRDFVVVLLEAETGWAVGRKESDQRIWNKVVRPTRCSTADGRAGPSQWSQRQRSSRQGP